MVELYNIIYSNLVCDGKFWVQRSALQAEPLVRITTYNQQY